MLKRYEIINQRFSKGVFFFFLLKKKDFSRVYLLYVLQKDDKINVQFYTVRILKRKKEESNSTLPYETDNSTLSESSDSEIKILQYFKILNLHEQIISSLCI